MKATLDQATDPWGVRVQRVEVKDVRLPVQLQRAMAAEAEAARESRAKVVAAEGEQKASHALQEAAQVLQGSPHALQVRYSDLQTVLVLMYCLTASLSTDSDLHLSRTKLYNHFPQAYQLSQVKHCDNSLNCGQVIISTFML